MEFIRGGIIEKMFREIDIKKFHATSYFSEVYFNCSMDWSDLEYLLGDFLMRENQKIVDAFKNEVEILYMYAVDGVMSEKDIAGILTGRGISNQKAESVINLFYKRVEKLRFRNICYFYNCRFGCHISLFDLENRIENFLMWENIMTLEREIDMIYKLNDFNIMREVERIEKCIDTFYKEGDNERVNAFRKEIEAVCTRMYNPELMKKIAHMLGGDLRVPLNKAVSVIKLLVIVNNCVGITLKYY